MVECAVPSTTGELHQATTTERLDDITRATMLGQKSYSILRWKLDAIHPRQQGSQHPGGQ